VKRLLLLPKLMTFRSSGFHRFCAGRGSEELPDAHQRKGSFRTMRGQVVFKESAWRQSYCGSMEKLLEITSQVEKG
jgi:hypothetical protein